MKSPTIFIADDNDEYREGVVEFLEFKNYLVIDTGDLGQAKTILEKGGIDVALLDIRMNHNKPNDDSGLRLAIETAPQIPKIIITAYPQFDYVRAAMRRIGGRLPAVVDFLDKGEGLDALLAAITKILPMRDIFVVHGHDDIARLEVEKYLTQLHLNPIILKDQVNAGQLIMEKLERAAGSIYAIVLMTPDDHCNIVNEGNRDEYRARQNVVLELGYFAGKLGRDRLCVLFGEGVTPPSDIHGLTWIKLEREGAWKIAVARELRAAGIYIDLNDIL